MDILKQQNVELQILIEKNHEQAQLLIKEEMARFQTEIMRIKTKVAGEIIKDCEAMNVFSAEQIQIIKDVTQKHL